MCMHYLDTRSKIPQLSCELPFDIFKYKLYNWLFLNPFPELDKYFELNISVKSVFNSYTVYCECIKFS